MGQDNTYTNLFCIVIFMSAIRPGQNLNSKFGLKLFKLFLDPPCLFIFFVNTHKSLKTDPASQLVNLISFFSTFIAKNFLNEFASCLWRKSPNYYKKSQIRPFHGRRVIRSKQIFLKIQILKFFKFWPGLMS